MTGTIRSRIGRATFSVAVSAFLLVSVIGLNVIAERTGAIIDLTDANRLTLSPQTREVLGMLEDRLHIQVFVRPDSEAGRDARALAERYADANDRIDLEIVDPDAEPGRVASLGVTRFGTSVLEYQGRRIDVESTNEADLTTAILRLVRGSEPLVCVVTGHGEAAIDDAGPQGLQDLGELAQRNGFAVEPRNVGVDGLDGCVVVVLAGPRVPFAGEEQDLLADFLTADGKMLVLADALSETDVNPLTTPWGISFLGGVVLDNGSNFANDVSTPVLTDLPSANPVVEEVPSLLAPAAAGLLADDPDPRPGLHVSVLARSSSDSVLAVDPEDPSRGGLAGPVVVAAAADDSRVEGDPPTIHRTRLLVVADTALAQNATLPALGNARFLANGLSWLVQDERLLTIATGRRPYAPLDVSPSRRRTALATTAIIVPLLVLLAGLTTASLRRRR